jgi:cysteine-rich repeat protein
LRRVRGCRAPIAALVSVLAAASAVPSSVGAASLGLRPIQSVRIGGDDAVQLPLTALFHWYDDFGAAVAPIGDMDGDGVGDIAVGAPDERLEGNAGPGNVIIIFLESDGGVKDALALGGFDGAGIGAMRASGDHFGAAVAAIGDLDGNGYGDLVVGAPGDDTAAEDAGAVYAVFLGAGASVVAETKITSGLAGFDFELTEFARLGSSVAVLPGAASGSVEILAGAPTPADEIGRVFTLVLDGTGSVATGGEIRADDETIAGDAAARSQFGAAVAVPGDLDANGAVDFIVGSPDFDTLGNQRGSVWVLLRNAAGGVQSSVRIGAHSGGFDTDLPVNARFGAAVAGIGDTDENEVPDIAVGAPGSAAVWALLLNSAGTVTESRRFDNESFFEPVPLPLGTAVASIGDLDGNGIPDFAIGGNATFEGFPGTTTTTLFCTTFVSTTTSLTTTTLPDATALESTALCRAPTTTATRRPHVGRDTTPSRCFRPNGSDICGRPKVRRCGIEHVRIVLLDENADIATCGDSVRDPGEACDDGNTADGDCCTADCQTAPNGNECAFDENPCVAHLCNGAGECEPVEVGGVCADFFACIEGGTCNRGECKVPGATLQLCRDDDGECLVCGQPVSAGDGPTATDALYALQASVGLSECLPCICDVTFDGNVTSADALRLLNQAIALVPVLNDCPHR